MWRYIDCLKLRSKVDFIFYRHRESNLKSHDILAAFEAVDQILKCNHSN